MCIISQMLYGGCCKYCNVLLLINRNNAPLKQAIAQLRSALDGGKSRWIGTWKT